MFFVRYDFPLPNNGDRYDLSQDELVKLLDSAYDRGYAHGVESTIKPETITATLPVGDPDHLWNKDIYNSKYEVIDKAIDEIHLLETLVDVDKYSVSVYNSFRKEVCAGCNDPNCLKSQVEIYDCRKFENYFEI